MVFDNNDEVDAALTCLMSEAEEEQADYDIDHFLEHYSEILEANEEDPDVLDIELDESITDPIGMDAEEEIDIDQELLLGDDEDNNIIDLLMADEI